MHNGITQEPPKSIRENGHSTPPPKKKKPSWGLFPHSSPEPRLLQLEAAGAFPCGKNSLRVCLDAFPQTGLGEAPSSMMKVKANPWLLSSWCSIVNLLWHFLITFCSSCSKSSLFSACNMMSCVYIKLLMFLPSANPFFLILWYTNKLKS